MRIAGGVWELGQPGLDSVSLKQMTDAWSIVGQMIRDNGLFPLGHKPLSRQLASLGVALDFAAFLFLTSQLGHQPLGNEDGSVQIVF